MRRLAVLSSIVPVMVLVLATASCLAQAGVYPAFEADLTLDGALALASMAFDVVDIASASYVTDLDEASAGALLACRARRSGRSREQR